jgi:uncharacterized protein (DUF488 family)
VEYDRLAATDLFKSGIERLLDGVKTHRIALMCAEREPLNCHRTLLVSRALEKRGLEIMHILPDSALEAHADTMRRLAAELGLSGDDLFSDTGEMIDLAYAQQADRIAYRRSRA